MENTNSKTALQIMYETVMEEGGPQGPLSQAVVDAFEGKQTEPVEQKAIVQFKKQNTDYAISSTSGNTEEIFKKNITPTKKDAASIEKQDAQRQIADDEFYAGLQSVIEKDVVASKYFNPDDITYPLMEQSGDYNIAGIQADASGGLAKLQRKLIKQGMSKTLTSASTFKDKIAEGRDIVGIFQNPVANENDIKKIRTILHEVRHKAFDDPKNTKFLLDNRLNEEVFNLFLDYKNFPELRPMIKDELNEFYSTGFNGFKGKYMPAVDEFEKINKKNIKSDK